MYIHDKTKPFPWHLRLSFATDIARALAYLHARKCIHRDLKGENLLVTANGRLKITDFGFARITARNEDESKRLTFCGTDSYMSPEILLGEEFDLPTDIFSFGIILCEIAARKLADDEHFKRCAPTFGMDEKEVLRLANSDCPPAFLKLCIDCLASEPASRPTTRVILDRLREIEAEVLARPSEGGDLHVGSVKFMKGGSTRHGIPSFSMGLGKKANGSPCDSSDDSDGSSLMEAVKGLDALDLNPSWNTALSGELLGPGCSSIFFMDSIFLVRASRCWNKCSTSSKLHIERQLRLQHYCHQIPSIPFLRYSTFSLFHSYHSPLS